MSETSNRSEAETASPGPTDRVVRRVALVDDAYDPLDQMELRRTELDELWARLVASEVGLDELERIGHRVSQPNHLTGAVLEAFHANRGECPTFESAWQSSQVGMRVESARGMVERLAQLLEQSGGLRVLRFGRIASTDELTAEAPELIFLDWYLGDDTATAIETAIARVTDILSSWPSENPKPLIVLMSSRPGLPEHADEFCRRSKILRGMFYAVPKSELVDPFKLEMHMHLFATSLPAARRVQGFIDALDTALTNVKDEFIAGISELTMSDYAYIQTLSLQADGQPLGDYLLWLFNTYLGQLLFAGGLEKNRADLDTMAFASALPSPAAPSERLTELYHCAVFDTNVGPIGSHPRAPGASVDGVSFEQPLLSLGDILVRTPQARSEIKPMADSSGAEPSGRGQGHARAEPDLLLVLNAQCDLAFAPGSEARQMDPERAILLLPGYFKGIREPVGDKRTPKTELYLHERGSYRVEWDTKRITAVPYGEFAAWKETSGRERVGRLRMPFALELQRAFAADLTRVGMPVMPPIFQPIMARVLRIGMNGLLEATEELRDEEAAFLVLNKKQEEIQQQCVLTMPLVAHLRELLGELARHKRLEMDAAGSAARKPYAVEQMNALERALDNQQQWISMLYPFPLPGPKSPRSFVGNNIQLVRGAGEGDTPSGHSLLVVSLSLDLA